MRVALSVYGPVRSEEGTCTSSNKGDRRIMSLHVVPCANVIALQEYYSLAHTNNGHALGSSLTPCMVYAFVILWLVTFEAPGMGV